MGNRYVFRDFLPIAQSRSNCLSLVPMDPITTDTLSTEAMRIPAWTLGDRLNKSRRAAGISVQDMAEQLGVNRRTVTNYEQDHTEPRFPTIKLWADLTGVPAAWLRYGVDLISTETASHLPNHGSPWTAPHTFEDHLDSGWDLAFDEHGELILTDYEQSLAVA